MKNQNPVPSSKDATNIFSYAIALVIAAGVVLELLTSVDFFKALLEVAAIVTLLAMLGALQLMNNGRFF